MLYVSENKFWVSSNGDFTLGFFSHSDQPNQYGVGIRYNSNSIPHDKQTLVWVAGGDLHVSNQSYFQLTNEGNLVLCNSNGIIAWTSGNSNFSVAFAVLGNDGNLVLMSKSQKIVWRSFDTPYNVLLPGQILPVDRTLRAARQNSVSSYYTLMIDADELQLRWETSVSYWKSGTARHPVNYAVVTADGALQLVDRSSEPVWSAFAQDHNDSDVNFRCPFSLTLESNSRCLAPNLLKCESHVDMVQLEYTLLYGIHPPNETVTFLSLKQCKDLCIKDADCVAVTYMNDGTAQCRMEKTIHLSGYSFPSMKAVSFVKKCSFSNPLSVNPKKASTSFSNKDLTENFKHRIGPTMFKGMLSEKTLVSVKDLKATTEKRRMGLWIDIGDSKLSKKLSWRKRFRICLSVARAISYLHSNCREFISHGNLKCENVVPDENFEAKVTEFGLGIVYGEALTTADGVVADFGKMIVMLVIGKRDEDVFRWVYRKWADGQGDHVVDKRIEGGLDSEELERVLRIAFWCLQVDERMRPSMGEVVKVLEGTLSVDPPSPPIFHQDEVDE
ncbi:Bulb-type lectin domain [Dillenia turbinata]|uniref:non-specific serine/threonine protein kinase n=1 Tax=Dillenia turbinata TaxID=194707 RepID=A0AAN8ZHZ0_9MAGN